MSIRPARVMAFCNWLDTIPANPPFHSHPEFCFYADLTDAEIDEAEIEMRRRADEAFAEAAALRRGGANPDAANDDER